jgi:mRNA interferase RelE/StbE
MRYSVKPSRKAEKELNHLDREILRRIQTRIDELAQDPFDPRLSHQLEMSPEQRYSRVGDWRIIFEVDVPNEIMNVAAIQHRSRVYKKL